MIKRHVLFAAAFILTVAQTPPVKHFAIVYSQTEGVTRRIIIPDSDAELNAKFILMPGEAMLVLARDQLSADKRVTNGRIQAITGKAPSSDRCVFVNDAGAVVAVHYCDPSIDSPPPGTKFAAFHETAVVGDVWENNNFTRAGAVLK